MSMTTTDTVTEAERTSLVRRLRAAHKLFDIAVADLTREQAAHVERKDVLPIAFSLAHLVISQDRSMTRLFGAPLLWDAHAGHVGLTGGIPYRGSPMAEAMKVRLHDMDAWRVYQREVFARTEHIVATATLEKLAELYPDTPTGAAFLALLVDGAPVRIIDAVEAWIYQHAIRHAGELEHARALVGLGGLA